MIPIGAMTVDGRSRSLNAARLINLYPEITAPDSMSRLVLRSTPGLSQFAVVGAGPIRGQHVMDSVLFVVSGTDLYSVDSNGTPTLRGSAGTIAGTGAVQMASNLIGELVIINSAGTGWVWDGSLLQSLSTLDADFGDDAISVTFQDQYMVYGRIGTGQVFVSDLNNAKSYTATAFATAEFADDDVTEVYSHAGNLWVFGERTTEIWYNAGTTPFPFVRVGGAVFTDIGGTLNTVADVDEALYWWGTDRLIYQAVGLQPRRISTSDIEHRIKDWTGARGFSYKNEGHAFYVLSADQGCVVYDAATQRWHERQTFALPRWRACCYSRAYDRHLVGDSVIGLIYDMDLDTHADGAAPLQRRAITPPIHNDGLRVFMSEAQVHFEHGRGLSGSTVLGPSAITDLPFGENLLTRSEEFDHADWVKTGTTVTADAVADPNGVVTADKLVEDTGSGAHRITAGPTCEPSTQYTLSLYLKAAERRYGRVRLGTDIGFLSNVAFDLVAGTINGFSAADSAAIEDAGDGWYRISITDTTQPDATKFNLIGAYIWDTATGGSIGPVDAYAGDGTSGYYIWGAQLEKASSVGSYVKTGAATAFRNLDPASTNLITRSEEIDHADWSAAARTTVTANATTAPDGNVTADELVETTETGEHYTGQTVAGITAGEIYTWSVFVKAASGARTLRLRTTTSAPAFADFDPALGTFGTISDCVATVSTAPNGFYRVAITVTAISTGNVQGRLQMYPTGGSSNYTGDGVSGLYFWGAQLENQTAATSYIKTEATSESRALGPTYLTYDQDADEIRIAGFIGSATALLAVGDAFNLTIDGISRGYTAASQADSDLFGVAAFGVSPSLVEPVQGSDPQVVLDWSDDGGHTYGIQRQAALGKVGEYETRAIWRRLGHFRMRNYRLTYSEPTPFAIYGVRL